MTYDEYLQNLMGDLNPQGGMMTRYTPTANVGLEQAVSSMFPADTGGAYTPRPLSDLNAVRAAKQAEIAQRNAAAVTTTPTAQSALANYVSGGGGADYGMASSGGYGIGQGVNQNAAALGLNLMAGSEKLQMVSPFLSAIMGLIGTSIADQQINANSAADAALSQIATENMPGVLSVSDKDGNIYSKVTPESIAKADAAIFAPTQSEMLAEQTAGMFSPAEEAAAATYGTTLGSQQNSMLAAQDASFTDSSPSSDVGYSVTDSGWATDYGGGYDSYGESSSSSGGSSSKIVCTAMNQAYGFGSFRNQIWLKYAADNLTKAHEVGYHTMFLPLIDLGYKKNIKPIRKALEHIARHRTKDIRAEMRNGKRDKLGRAYRFVLEPLCYAVGKLKGY